MKKLFLSTGLIVLFSVLAFIPASFAGEQVCSGVVQGTNIPSGVIDVEDIHYGYMKTNSNWSNAFSNASVENYVILRYTGSEGKTAFYNSGSWNLTVTYNITTYPLSGPSTTLTGQTISINYDPSAPFQDIAVKAITPAAYKVKVQVTASSLSNLTSDFSLEAEIRTKRYYNIWYGSVTPTISCTAPTPPSTIDPSTTHEVEFSWDKIKGAEDYDLEWVYYYTQPTSPDFSNATRITTPENMYKINLVYEEGYVYYRIRGVGRMGSSFDRRDVGPWSTDANDYFVMSASHDNARSWTYGVTYAEDGKRKEVVTYFDESLRQRQTVVKNNTDNAAIVSETMYDFEGRPAVTTLPEPSRFSSDLKFNDLYNLNGSNNPFSKEDFDAVANYDSPGTISGSSSNNYYEQSISATDGFEAYIPNAGYYPYTRTLYGADGRVKKEAGPGTDHKIGSGHETEYAIGTPLQKKLDMLFGTEAGISTYYKEYAVKDANGQYSIAYQNLRGQTVATALAGDAPAGMDDISTTRTVTTDLNNDNAYIAQDEAWVSHTELFVPVAGYYKLNYTLTSEAYNKLCIPSPNNVFDCQYDVSITVYDACNGIVDDASTPPVGTVKDVLHNNNITTWQFTALSASSLTTGDFYVYFSSPGNYTLEKRLTLNQQHLDAEVESYRNYITASSSSYLSGQTCVSSLTSFQDNLYNNTDLSECSTCTSGCEPEQNNCDDLYKILVADMSPGGQYFDGMYNIATAPSHSWLSSYVWADGTSSSPGQWTYGNYLDPNNSNALIYTWNDLASHWQSSFVDQDINGNVSPNNGVLDPSGYGMYHTNTNYLPYDSLVQFHPEFCHYDWCVRMSPSTQFDVDLYSHDYSWAVTEGYIVTSPSVSISASKLLDGTGTGSGAGDPFWNTGSAWPATASGFSANYETPMSSKVTAGYNSGTQSMWDYVGTLMSGCTSGCNDLHWQLFVNEYLYQKQQLTEQYKSSEFHCQYLYDGNTVDQVAETRPVNNTYLDTKANRYKIRVFPPQTMPAVSATDPFASNICMFNDNSVCEKIASAAITVSTYTNNLSVTVNSVDVSGTVSTTGLTSATQVAEALANAINTYSSSPNYYACSNPGNSTITIYPEPFTGAGPNTYPVGTTNFTITQSSPEMAGGMDDTCNFSTNVKNCMCEEMDQLVEDGTASGAIPTVSAAQYVATRYSTVYGITVTASDVSTWMSNCSSSLSSSQGQSPETWNATTETYSSTVPVELRCYEYQSSCFTDAEAITDHYGLAAYLNAIEQAVQDFRNELKAHCLGLALPPATASTNTAFSENFTLEYTDKEYHYTLYYYDLAGNLTRTVPPEVTDRMFDLGVLDQAYLDIYRNHHDNGVTPDFQNPTYYNSNLDMYKRALTATANTQSTPVKNTVYATNYKYNTLEQVIKEETPDAGVTEFWYDDLGRMKASRNAKQLAASPDGYSYTSYDALGRVTEVGQVGATGTPPSSELNNASFPTTAWYTGSKEQVTHTYYDNTTISVGSQFSTGTQDNLRSRVVHVTYEDTDDGLASTYNHGTHYSYDIHGNVKELVQDNPSLSSFTGQQYKNTRYEYDLVSGNVNKVIYQSGAADQFMHRYWYDADNRIESVYTSRDGIIWDHDADYYYYTHGPLARTELGDKKVQGQDYAYTILGWIKGVNSEILAGTNDIGKDGVDDASTTGSYKPSTPDIHAQVASDVFGYSLGYFSGDYSPINSSIIPANLFTANTASASYLSTYGPNLYNGNISHMVTTITDPTTLTVMPQLTAYRYDQLNRVKNMRAYRDISSNAWGSGSTYNGIYETKIAYDPNGNITGMYRNGNLTASLLMDSLSYKYNANTNKLNYVRDRVSNSTAHSSNYTNDIDDQIASNYDYDEIGNLIKDAQEYINPASSPSGIEWNVYGKITKVTRTTDVTCQLPDLEFAYDASGNRIMKLKKPRVNGALQASNTWEYTYYVRDAQGNVLATYKRPGNNNSTIWLDNQYMYGSSRLGMVMRNVNITSAAAPSTPYYRTIGEKYFELSNHLGNVLSTVTDRKKANDIYTFTNVGVGSGSYTYSSTFNSYLFVGAGNGSYNRSSGTDGWSDYYTADIKSTADYGVWGDELDGRTASSNSYRYGFNGQEKDDEITGQSGTSYTAEFWQYDSRLGRRWNIDPIPTESESSYTTFNDNPISNIDPLGNKSTHTDKDGKVVAVYNDGDNGVYKHEKLPEIYATTDNSAHYDKEKNRIITPEKLTIENTTKMGETLFWDEFLNAHTHMPAGKILFDGSWDETIKYYNDYAKEHHDLIDVALNSTGGEMYDIKTNKELQDPYGGVMTGKLLDGKYATLRSAGNYLAGLNGHTIKQGLLSVSKEQYMLLAGALNAGGKKLLLASAPYILTKQITSKNWPYPAPYFGELPYSGRMINLGWESVKK